MIFISILILIVAIALPSFKKQLYPILFIRISSIIFLYAGALSFNALYIQSIGSGIGIYSGLFHITIISQFLEVFLLLIGSLILISWPINNNIKIANISDLSQSQLFNKDDYINQNVYINNSKATEYSLIVLFSTLGASLLVSSSDFISMYLSIELQSFGLYILATLYRDSESATSAGLKYFLLGGLSSCLILLGTSLMYTYTGLTNFESIYNLISVSDNYNIMQGLSLGLIFIIIGFLFKIAAAPLHNWAPDVYDDSPTIVTIWLTIMPKISILVLLLELQTQIGLLGNISSIYLSTLQTGIELLDSITLSNFSINNIYKGVSTLESINSEINTIYALKLLLLICSLLSLIIGTVVGLAQTKIKRLLAYSTISHIGFILLALVINTEQSIDSFIFYIIQYSITNLNTFLIIIALGYIIQASIRSISNISSTSLHTYKDNLSSEIEKIKYNNKLNNLQIETISDIRFISEFKNQFFYNPLLSLNLSVCLFSMAGVPPLIGFFAKQFVLYSAIQNGYYFISIIAILVSVISASYYLKIIKVLYTDISLNNEMISNNNKNTSYSNVLLNEEPKLNYLYINIAKKEEKHNYNNLNQNKIILSNFHSFTISTLTLTIILFVLKPSIILNSTQLLALSLYHF